MRTGVPHSRLSRRTGGIEIGKILLLEVKFRERAMWNDEFSVKDEAEIKLLSIHPITASRANESEREIYRKSSIMIFAT